MSFDREQPDAAEKKNPTLGTAPRQDGTRDCIACTRCDNAQGSRRATSATCRKTRSRVRRARPGRRHADRRRGRRCRDAPNEARMREAASDPALLATEAAHYLVARARHFAKRTKLSARCSRGRAHRKTFPALPFETLRKYSPLFAADFFDALNLDAALASPDVDGGTRRAVREAIAAAKDAWPPSG